MTKRKRMSPSLRFDVLHRDGFKCRYCGTSQEQGAVLHVDHVVAVANGGEDQLDNLVTACAPCNFGKAAKVLRPLDRVEARKTFGLSFGADGRVEWQFVVLDVSEHGVEVQLFSWASGEETTKHTVSRGFLDTRCLLFTTPKAFWDAGEFWGDIRADRVNAVFVNEGAFA